MNRHHIKFVTAVFSILALAGALHAAAPACAYADGGDTTGTAACGNGWVLSYSANEELARITGVETPGVMISSSLTMRSACSFGTP